MARKLFRLESLTPDERRVLQQLARGDESLLEKIEKTGKIPNELIAGLGANEIASLQPLFAKVGGVDRKEIIERFIKAQGEESGLSEEALRERLQAFQELGGIQGQQLIPDNIAIENEIRKIARSHPSLAGLSDEALNSVAATFANDIIRGEANESRFAGLVESKVGNLRPSEVGEIERVGRNITTDLQPRFQRGEFFTGVPGGENIPVSEDVKRVQDILSGFEATRAKEGELQSFLAKTPEELRTDRASYLSRLESSGQRYLSERFLPSALKELTRRGLATNVGEVSSLLAAETGKVQERIEQEYATLEQQDNLFFADAAFRLQQTKLDIAEDDFRRQVDFERARTRQEQGQRFAERERGLQTDFEKNLLQRELERKRATGVEEISLGKAEQQRQQTAQNIATVGQSATEVAGSALTREKLPSEKG